MTVSRIAYKTSGLFAHAVHPHSPTETFLLPGYYPRGADRADHQKAQVDMIDLSLKWAGVSDTTRIRNMVDVGCGIGGSSRHISRKFGCVASGVTLSPIQAARATALSREAFLDKNDSLRKELSFQVADALDQPFDNNSFDLVWSMESG